MQYWWQKLKMIPLQCETNKTGNKSNENIFQSVHMPQTHWINLGEFVLITGSLTVGYLIYLKFLMSKLRGKNLGFMLMRWRRDYPMMLINIPTFLQISKNFYSRFKMKITSSFLPCRSQTHRIRIWCLS